MRLRKLTGRSVRDTRHRLDLSRREVAERAEVDDGILEQWEIFDLEIPAEPAHRLRWALWDLEVLRLLRERGVPECEWMSAAESVEAPDFERMREHAESCPACLERERVVAAHGPRPPGLEGVLARAMRRLEWLPGPLRSAAVATLCVLAFTGIPILWMLGYAVAGGGMELLTSALGFFGGSVAVGLGAGLAHHAGRRLRERGRLGYHLSWALVGYGALLGAGAAWLAGFLLAPGHSKAAVLAEAAGLLAEPLVGAILLVVGALLGIALGRAAKRMSEEQAAPPEPAGEPVEEPSRFRVVLNWAVAGLAVLMVAFQWWLPAGEVDGGTEGGWTHEELRERLPELEASAREAPGDARALYDYAQALALHERAADALALADSSVGLEPDDPEALNLLGWLLLQEDRPDEARPYFERAEELQPDYPYPGINLADIHFRRGEWERAAERYERAIERLPEDPWLHSQLALSLGPVGRRAEALAAAERAHELSGGTQDTHGILALALYEVGRYAEALVHAREAASHPSDDPWYPEMLGKASLAVDDYEGALEAYREAARLAPDHPRMWLQVGRIAVELERPALAHRAFSRVDSLAPGHFERSDEDREAWERVRR